MRCGELVVPDRRGADQKALDLIEIGAVRLDQVLEFGNELQVLGTDALGALIAQLEQLLVEALFDLHETPRALLGRLLVLRGPGGRGRAGGGRALGAALLGLGLHPGELGRPLAVDRDLLLQLLGQVLALGPPQPLPERRVVVLFGQRLELPGDLDQLLFAFFHLAARCPEAQILEVEVALRDQLEPLIGIARIDRDIGKPGREVGERRRETEDGACDIGREHLAEGVHLVLGPLGVPDQLLVEHDAEIVGALAQPVERFDAVANEVGHQRADGAPEGGGQQRVAVERVAQVGGAADDDLEGLVDRARGLDVGEQRRVHLLQQRDQGAGAAPGFADPLRERHHGAVELPGRDAASPAA